MPTVFARGIHVLVYRSSRATRLGVYPMYTDCPVRCHSEEMRNEETNSLFNITSGEWRCA